MLQLLLQQTRRCAAQVHLRCLVVPLSLQSCLRLGDNSTKHLQAVATSSCVLVPAAHNSFVAASACFCNTDAGSGFGSAALELQPGAACVPGCSITLRALWQQGRQLLAPQGCAATHGIWHYTSTASGAESDGSTTSSSSSSQAGPGHNGSSSSQAGPGHDSSTSSDSGSKASSLQRSSDIRSAAGPQQLLQVLQQHAAAMDAYNISTAFSRAAKLCGRRHAGSAAQEPLLLGLLQQLAEQLHASTDPPAPASELATVIYASGQLQLPGVVELLLPQLLQQDRLPHASTRHISNALHGAVRARAALQDCQLQQLLGPFCAQLATANDQDVSTTLWVLAVTGKQVPAAQLQLLADRAREVLPDASPQAVSSMLWALAKLQHQQQQQHNHHKQQLLPPERVEVFVARFMQLLPSANAQDISTLMTAAASTGHVLQPPDMAAVGQAFVGQLGSASARAVKDVLASVASMGLRLPQQQLQACLDRFVQLAQSGHPQSISTVLWALAKLGRGPSGSAMYLKAGRGDRHLRQLRLLEGALVSVGARATLQDHAVALRACADLRFYPERLLAATEQDHAAALTEALQAGGPSQGAVVDIRCLASLACACAHFGHTGKLLPRQLLLQAVQQLPGSRRDFRSSCRGLVNLCWAAAVLDLQDCTAPMLQLVGACREAWGVLGLLDLLQLYQVHLWMQDSAAAAAPGASEAPTGLQGVLAAEQLEQCRAAWLQQQSKQQIKQQGGLGPKPSNIQADVFEALQGLPGELLSWQVAPCMGQHTADGHYSPDIAAVTAGGKQLAIEVDGPWHFLQPGNRLDGTTQARNRALVARGYVVVSIPYYEWRQQRSQEQRQRFLLSKLLPVVQD